MIRHTLFIITVIGTAATALAAVQPAPGAIVTSGSNVTVVEKTDAFPFHGPIVVGQCAKEDCSDTQS
jgi:hypothetical protein